MRAGKLAAIYGVRHKRGGVPPCPLCRTAVDVVTIGTLEFRCNRCRGLFDNQPNEGGDYFADPSKRLERQEEHRGRR